MGADLEATVQLFIHADGDVVVSDPRLSAVPGVVFSFRAQAVRSLSPSEMERLRACTPEQREAGLLSYQKSLERYLALEAKRALSQAALAPVGASDTSAHSTHAYAPSATEVLASWMADRVRQDGVLRHESVVAELRKRALTSLLYANANGRDAISRELLLEFRVRTEGWALWDDSALAWRLRARGDGGHRSVDWNRRSWKDAQSFHWQDNPELKREILEARYAAASLSVERREALRTSLARAAEHLQWAFDKRSSIGPYDGAVLAESLTAISAATAALADADRHTRPSGAAG